MGRSVGNRERPGWAKRLRTERDVRRWSQTEFIRQLRRITEDLPNDEGMLRNIRGWENGSHRPNQRYQHLIAEVYDTTAITLFGASEEVPAAELNKSTGGLDHDKVSTVELVEQIRRTDLDQASLDTLAITVDRLCTAYSTISAERVREDAQSWLGRISEYLDRRPSQRQHTEILSHAAWITLLIGCTEYDLGDRAAAEQTRLAAQKLAVEAENVRAQAWVHELAAWFALTTHEWRNAIDEAQAGQAVFPGSDASVQLAGQEAEAWARMGETSKALEALDRGRRTLDAIPPPGNPSNHFVVDHDRFDKVSMNIARLDRQSDLAAHYANEILRKGLRPDGTYRLPMRVSEAKATLAVTAAWSGKVSEAVRLGHESLNVSRRSIPSLLLVGQELVSELAELAPESDEVTGLVDRITDIQSEVANSGPALVG